MDEPPEEKLKAISSAFKQKDPPKTQEELIERCKAEVENLRGRMKPRLDAFKAATLFEVIHAMQILAEDATASFLIMECALGAEDRVVKDLLSELLQVIAKLMSLAVKSTVEGGWDGMTAEQYESLSSQVGGAFKEASL